MKASTGQHYRRRLITVVDYLYSHLDGQVDVNQLAEVANMSPYHFHRIYRQMAGETINSTTRRLRLQRAASELLRSPDALHLIASRVGYGSLEAFSRAFRREFDQNPSDYRLEKSDYRAKNAETTPTGFVATLAHDTQEYTDMYPVEMIDTPVTQLIAYEHLGDYMGIGNAFSKLEIYASSHDLIKPSSRSIGIYYGDPKSLDKTELRAHACLSVEQPLANPSSDSPDDLSIPAGRCATVLFKGSYAELEKAYDWMFGQWLPSSGFELANFPPFEEYLNDTKSTPPSELLTRIHFLLA